MPVLQAVDVAADVVHSLLRLHHETLMLLHFDLDNTQHRRAVKAAAKTLRLPVVRQPGSGGARFTVEVESALQAYGLGLETMKRMTAAPKRAGA